MIVESVCMRVVFVGAMQSKSCPTSTYDLYYRFFRSSVIYNFVMIILIRICLARKKLFITFFFHLLVIFIEEALIVLS